MSKRTVLLEALASTPADLRLLLKRVDDAAADPIPTPTQWTIPQVLAHLLDIETRYQARLQRVINEDNPHLPAIHPHDTTATLPPLPDLLNQLNTARTHTITFLRALPPGSWQRPALHETQGPTHLRHLVQMLVEHDTEHLNQIIDLQQQ